MRWICPLLLSLTLMGCLPLQTIQLRRSRAPELQKIVQLMVPAYRNTGDQCGPAALAMELASLGVPVSRSVLSAAVYIPGKRGSLQVEMMSEARRQGMLVVQIPPELRSLWIALLHNRAPLLLVNQALSWWPHWHYVVVTGFEAHDQSWRLNTGRTSPESWPLPVLERVWMRAGGWGIVLIDPHRLNEQAADIASAVLLNAALDLERVRPDQAAQVYRALAQREPQDKRYLLLTGNAFREAQQPALAEEAYRMDIQRFPDDWRAFNNLVDLLQSQGRSCSPMVQNWLARADALASAAERLTVTATVHAVAKRCAVDGGG